MNAKRRRSSSGRKAAVPESKVEENDAAKNGSVKDKEDKADEVKEDSTKPKKNDGEPEKSEREIQAAKFNEINPSRTFLATVSVEHSRIEVSA